MTQSAFVHVALVVALTAGVAGMLAAEFFHGVEFLLPVGGALALLGVGGLTLAIARVEPPTDASSEH